MDSPKLPEAGTIFRILALALFGVLSAGYILVKAAYWLIHHLRFI